MSDPVTAGLFLIGAIAIGAWYKARSGDRETESRALRRGMTVMIDDDDDDEQPGRNLLGILRKDLPATFDEHWVEQRVAENMELLRSSQNMVESFFLMLRDRYHTRWEMELLDNLEQKLKKQISVMEVSSQHAVLRGTLRERTETEVYKAKTAHLQAKQEYMEAKERLSFSQQAGQIDGENRRLGAKVKNRELRKKLGEIRRDHQQVKVERENISRPVAPVSPSPPAERDPFEQVAAADRTMALVNHWRAAQQTALDEAEQKGFGPDTEHYKRVFNYYESQIEEILLRR